VLPLVLYSIALDWVLGCEGVTVSTLSLGIPRSVLGIGVTYEMWNISWCIDSFSLETFRVFGSYHSGSDCAKIRVGHRLKFWARGGEENILTPYISPNFGSREPTFFVSIEIQESHFCFEFQDPNLKIGVWGHDRRNKKIHIFRQGAPISNQFTGHIAKRR